MYLDGSTFDKTTWVFFLNKKKDPLKVIDGKVLRLICIKALLHYALFHLRFFSLLFKFFSHFFTTFSVM